MQTHLSGEPNERLAKFGFKDELSEEFSSGAIAGASVYLYTGYPKPLSRFRLVTEASHRSVEETYFWILEHTRMDQSFGLIDKITDIFSASEQSAFWGQASQRIGIQQDRVQNYLASIGKFIKDLFAMVRELRILDEKLEPRRIWNEAAGKGGKAKAADATLKSEFTDLVENRGGQVQPGSIYHLAQSVGYTTLPDLYFNTQVYRLEDIDKVVDDLEFNKNVKNVLRRKLFQFINWKIKTDHELEQRRTFLIKYMRQHWDIIRMYMSWVKPYLRNVQRLQMNHERTSSPELISAFEGSLTEIEFLARKPLVEGYHPVILVSFLHRTTPSMDYHQEGYQHRGPLHKGRIEVTMRSYAWTPEQVEQYKAYRAQEEMDLLGVVDDGIKAAMDALGDDMERYLAEAGAPLTQKKAEPEAHKPKPPGTSDPFIALLRGFADLGSLVIPTSSADRKGTAKRGKPKQAQKSASGAMYQIYKNYKKSHRMLSW